MRIPDEIVASLLEVIEDLRYGVDSDDRELTKATMQKLLVIKHTLEEQATKE